jgi:hypothetical protein
MRAARPTVEEGLKDLYNELRWLLSAATQWDAWDKLVEGPPHIKEPCHHLKVYAMDSAMLHARSLFEFFTTKKPSKDRLCWRDFGLAKPLKSKRYKALVEPLNARLMHVKKNRAGRRQVKNEVVNLARDVVELWDKFSHHPALDALYKTLLDEHRTEAMAEAQKVAAQYGEYSYKSPFV